MRRYSPANSCFGPFIHVALHRSCIGLALAVSLAACSPKAQQTAPAPAVTFVTVEPRATTVTAEYTATIEALNTVEVRPRIGGLLLRQTAVEGTRVKKGQTLFVIDPAPYQAALARAQGDLAKANAALAPSQRNLERAKQLARQELISKEALDTTTGTYEGNVAAVEAARAAAQSAQIDLGYTNVSSPIDGIVGRLLVRTGGVVVASQTLLTNVYAVDQMYVNFGVSESTLPQLASVLTAADRQQEGRFKILLSDGSEYPLRGKLDFVDPAIDAQTGTLPVRLVVDNPEGALHSNQFARVVVPMRQIADALVVPIRAVQELQGKNYLWVIGPDGTAQQRDVKAGVQLGRAEWLIESGLKPAERVIIDGMQRLQPGVRVTAKPLDTSAATAKDSAQAP